MRELADESRCLDSQWAWYHCGIEQFFQVNLLPSPKEENSFAKAIYSNRFIKPKKRSWGEGVGCR
jgi:hypothetical protein